MENVNDTKSKEQMENYKSGFDYLNDVPVPLPNKSDNLKLIKADELEEEPIELDSRIFSPNWNNKPVEKEPILTLNGSPMLTYQNVSVFVAGAGTGKSSVCEAICGAVIRENKGGDTLGFEVSKKVKKVLFIDMERTNTDVWNSFVRMNKRAGLKQGDEQDKALFRGLRIITDLKERKESIMKLMKIHKPDLIILDGSGDLVDDPNCGKEAKGLTAWFRHLTSDFNCSIITTLHPNKGTDNMRGHVGGELLREAEGISFITKKGGIHRISSNHAQGKSRNSGPNDGEGLFTWSDSVNMFVNCYEEAGNVGRPKLEPLEDLSEDEIFALLDVSHGGLKA
mgnify:CR=1 FL=1